MVSEHSFVLFIIPVYILRHQKKKKKEKCEIVFTISDNMKRRQMGFNHRFKKGLGILDDQYKK